MSFKFTVKQNPLTIEFEAGSIGEAIGILQDSQTALGTIFATAAAIGANGADSTDETSTVNAPADNSQPLTAEQIAANAEKAAADAEAKALPQSGPGRPKLTDRQKAANARVAAANKAAAKITPPPVTASSPAPLPVPGTPAAPAAVDQTPNAKTGVPAFLDRTAPPPSPAAPAAPPPPPAPPPAPPVSRLCDAVIANLKQRKSVTADNGAALVTWLAQTGLVVNGASFDEAMAVLQFTDDAKLAPIAAALGVAA